MPRLLPVFLLLLLLAAGVSGWAQSPAEEKAPPLLPGTPPAAAAPVEPIRSTAEIRKMSRDQLASHPRVDIEGIILCVPWKGFPGASIVNPQVYQDGVAVFIWVKKAPEWVNTTPWLRMEPGDRVRIRGTA